MATQLTHPHAADHAAIPVPVLLLRRGPVPLKHLAALLRDERLEVYAPDQLSPEWLSFGHRAALTFVATMGDPLSALTYAITASLSQSIVLLIRDQYLNDRAELIEAGASDCIAMPVSASDVDGLVASVAARDSVAKVDPTLRLLLDPLLRTARLGKRSVRLSPREFALLYSLSARRGKPAKAELLLRDVWPDLPGRQSRQILDVYVYQLRKKLQCIGLARALVTVRGYGYSLSQSS